MDAWPRRERRDDPLDFRRRLSHLGEDPPELLARARVAALLAKLPRRLQVDTREFDVAGEKVGLGAGRKRPIIRRANNLRVVKNTDSDARRLFMFAAEEGQTGQVDR